VEVDVNSENGEVKVKRAVVGQDMGQLVNPQGAIIQAEGCVNMGLGYALMEDIEFDWGKLNQPTSATIGFLIFLISRRLLKPHLLMPWMNPHREVVNLPLFVWEEQLPMQYLKLVVQGCSDCR
jgi:xanthine dehydrogenase molybdopterin-binding subunit B